MQEGPDTRARHTPEGMLRSLRTQQRAYDPTPASGLRSTPTGVSSTGSPPCGPAELVSVPPSSTVPDTRGHPVVGDRPGPSTALHHPHAGGGDVLLRKEVIQPHLPVRLPCYDFVPIADPAFDGSLHKGWATGFGRYRLS